MFSLDDPGRVIEIRATLARKKELRKIYARIYRNYAEVASRCPGGGLFIELGSGGGFAKDHLPALVTTDILPYDGVDRVVDATAMPFEPGALSGIFMQNVLHHIPNPEAFFSEAVRCLKPGGKIYLFEPYRGWPSQWIYKWLHHEPFDDQAAGWTFQTSGPVSGANGAMPWLIFFRDRTRFERLYPALRIRSIRREMPLQYWASGGLSKPCVAPGPLFSAVQSVDRLLEKLAPQTASFFSAEIERAPDGAARRE